MVRLFLILLFSSSALADGHKTFSFTYESIIGKWESSYVSVKGEKQSLVLSKDRATEFLRLMPSGKEIFVSSSKNDIEVLEDIILIKYYDEFGLRYKMVLSGWHVAEFGQQASVLYGMLFLYQEGRQFNGFPVAFKPASEPPVNKSIQPTAKAPAD